MRASTTDDNAAFADSDKSNVKIYFLTVPKNDMTILLKMKRQISDERLANLLCISVQTFRKKKKNPDNFTLLELQGRALKFSPIQDASIILGRYITAKEAKDFILM